MKILPNGLIYMEHVKTDTTLEDRLKDYLENNMPAYLKILEQMVGINSFTANPVGIEALGDLTAEIFKPLGFGPERIDTPNPLHGPHLVLTRIGKRGSLGPTIGMISHLDTVFPRDEELRNGFSWRVEGDRAYGPGTVDIKGGTLIIYMIMAGLQALLPEVFEEVNWIILFNAAEETLEQQFGEVCKERIPANAHACLVFEGGRREGNQYSLVTARKGMVTYRIEVEGKAAHAGSAHQHGANAIVQMAYTVARIAEMTDLERGITFNVGTMAGGTVINRVPHQALASGEMRAYSPVVMGEGVSRLLALEEDVQVASVNDGYPCKVNISIVNRWEPWPPNPATNRLLAIWQENAASLGFEVVPQERGGLSDGNLMWDNVPTLDGLGPSGSNAHCSERSEDGSKDQEYVEISSFVPKTMLNTLAILRLLGVHF